MTDFFRQYFVDPIVTQGVAGYNLFNTPVYAIGFALAVFGTWKLLCKLNITIDRRFLIGILPFILSGGVWRVVRDAKIIESPWLVTPLIYFVIFAATVAALLVSVLLERKTKIKYHKPWFVIGLALLISAFALLAPIGIHNLNALAIIAILSLAWGAAIFTLYKLSSKIKAFAVFTKENTGLLWAHMFDATTTFTALQFFAESGYYEQHVVSGTVINALGPAAQFLLKLVVLIPVLWILDHELPGKKNTQLRGFLKIAILILGLALGTRNGIRLVLGV